MDGKSGSKRMRSWVSSPVASTPTLSLLQFSCAFRQLEVNKTKRLLIGPYQPALECKTLEVVFDSLIHLSSMRLEVAVRSKD